MNKLSWIKRRTRAIERYQWADTPTRRRLIECAFEDYELWFS